MGALVYPWETPVFACWLQRTRQAMSIVGIPEGEQDAVFRAVASVLHLGNIQFCEGAEPDSSQVCLPALAWHERCDAKWGAC